MAKKQTRRSVSMNRQVYDALKQHCEREGVSMSKFVESRIRSAPTFDMGFVPATHELV